MTALFKLDKGVYNCINNDKISILYADDFEKNYSARLIQFFDVKMYKNRSDLVESSNEFKINFKLSGYSSNNKFSLLINNQVGFSFSF